MTSASRAVLLPRIGGQAAVAAEPAPAIGRAGVAGSGMTLVQTTLKVIVRPGRVHLTCGVVSNGPDRRSRHVSPDGATRVRANFLATVLAVTQVPLFVVPLVTDIPLPRPWALPRWVL